MVKGIDFNEKLLIELKERINGLPVEFMKDNIEIDKTFIKIHREM